MIDIKRVNVFFITIGVIVFLLLLLIILPFFKTLVASALLAYIFYPLYNYIKKIVKNKNLASFIMLFLVLFLVIIPFFFIIEGFISESLRIYSIAKGSISENPIMDYLMKTNISIGKFGFFNFGLVITQVIEKIEGLIVNFTSKLVFSIPTLILHTFLLLFALFFFFRDGDKMINLLKKTLEISIKHKKMLEEEVSSMIHSVIYGNIMASLSQAIMATIGYFLFGINTPLLWGGATFFAALVPLVGAPLVWVPLSILRIIEGYFTNSNIMMIQGALLFIYGVLVVGTIDNIVRPKVIGSRSRMHPLLVFIAILGGIRVFGFIGIIAGPIIFVLAGAIIKMYLRYGHEIWVSNS